MTSLSIGWSLSCKVLENNLVDHHKEGDGTPVAKTRGVTYLRFKVDETLCNSLILVLLFKLGIVVLDTQI